MLTNDDPPTPTAWDKADASSEGQTVDHVLINADVQQSELLLNQRMGYVALSCAREDAIIFTNSIQELKEALDPKVDKERALEAVANVEDNFRDPREEKDPGELLNHKAAEARQCPETGGRKHRRGSSRKRGDRDCVVSVKRAHEIKRHQGVKVQI